MRGEGNKSLENAERQRVSGAEPCLPFPPACSLAAVLYLNFKECK